MISHRHKWINIGKCVFNNYFPVSCHVYDRGSPPSAVLVTLHLYHATSSRARVPLSRNAHSARSRRQILLPSMSVVHPSLLNKTMGLCQYYDCESVTEPPSGPSSDGKRRPIAALAATAAAAPPAGIAAGGSVPPPPHHLQLRRLQLRHRRPHRRPRLPPPPAGGPRLLPLLRRPPLRRSPHHRFPLRELEHELP